MRGEQETNCLTRVKQNLGRNSVHYFCSDPQKIIRILKSIIFTKLKKQKREVSMEDARLERRGMYSSRGSEEYIENYLLTRKVFEHLNDYDRDLVMLHWWFDNSFGEIALLYNKPKSTIQSQIERVERRGRKILGIK